MELESTSSQVPEGPYWPRGRSPALDARTRKATMCRTRDWKYVRRLYEPDELYDLRTDPREVENRIDDPACAGVLAELKERMLAWYQATCDVVPWTVDRR